VGVTTWSDWSWDRSCLSDAVCNFESHCATVSTYACTNFFSTQQLSRIERFPDAMHVTKEEKCDSLLVNDIDACKAWAEEAFGQRDSTLFLPGSPFCEILEQNYSRFISTDSPARAEFGLQGDMLLEESQTERSLLTRRNVFEDVQDWFHDLFHGKKSDDSRRRALAASGSPDAVTQSYTAISDNCDRNRCYHAATTHKLTRYHYIDNTKEQFKHELYYEGPFYTSFHIYEDFVWFFTHFPQDAYNFQWGVNQGGHAVVLIGWKSDCTYHGDKATLLSASLHTVMPAETAETSRRRTSKSECWELRNSWTDLWADEGYFHIVDDMLTGAAGANIHIASAAGDGAYSKSS